MECDTGVPVTFDVLFCEERAKNVCKMLMLFCAVVAAVAIEIAYALVYNKVEIVLLLFSYFEL